MTRTIHSFEDFIRLLRYSCESFVYHVRELEELYGETYRRDATFIMQRLEDFASCNHDVLTGVLHLYEGHTRELLEEYEAYRRTRHYRHGSEDEIEQIFANEPQMDHLSEFTSVEDCQALIDAAQLCTVEEYCTISSHRPFDENERWELARNPNYPATYCCLVGKPAAREVERQITFFNQEL